MRGWFSSNFKLCLSCIQILIDVARNMSELAAFNERISDLFRLRALQSHLSWDQQTKMPPEGASARGEMMAWLARKHHQSLTDEDLGRIISSLEKQDLSPDDQANVRLMRREYDKASLIPEELVNRMTKASSDAFMAWQEAKSNSDMNSFLPHLRTLIDLTKEKISYLGVESTPYDVLLDDYEVGMGVKDYDPFFSNIRQRLVPLFQAIQSSSTKIPEWPDSAIIPESEQESFCQNVINEIGFDLQAGRVDRAPHPFCSGLWPGDTRLTTRFDETQPFSSIYAAMHEAGHGLYEQGLNQNFAFSPRGQAVSLGVHESQSRFWENMVGRSQSFWDVAHSWYHECFHSKPDYDKSSLYNLVNQVKPSYIRVEADEISYNFHIMLRYEIEKKIFNDNLPVEKIEETWNDLFEDYFGIEVDCASNGCLQDVHWAYAAFGYFPTYTLGNVYAAQLYEAMQEDLGDLNQIISNGDWTPMKTWLNEKIHIHGSLMEPTELIEQATGKKPDSEPFLKYLESKFSQIYQL